MRRLKKLLWIHPADNSAKARGRPPLNLVSMIRDLVYVRHFPLFSSCVAFSAFCLLMFLYAPERERERERLGESERERVCVCVCVWERERERERERENWVNFQGHARCEGGRSNNCIDMKEPILWGIPNLQTRMSAKAKVELDTVQHEEPLVRRRVVSPEQVQLAFRICDCSVVNMVLSVIWHQNPTDISSRCCTTSEEVQCQNQTCVCVCVCVCVCEHCFPKALGECWPAYMSVVTTGVPVRVHMVATQQKIPLFGLLFVLTT